jgi:hypothetical protein
MVWPTLGVSSRGAQPFEEQIQKSTEAGSLKRGVDGISLSLALFAHSCLSSYAAGPALHTHRISIHSALIATRRPVWRDVFLDYRMICPKMA